MMEDLQSAIREAIENEHEEHVSWLLLQFRFDRENKK
jgi:hypothetical protein